MHNRTVVDALPNRPNSEFIGVSSVLLDLPLRSSSSIMEKCRHNIESATYYSRNLARMPPDLSMATDAPLFSQHHTKTFSRPIMLYRTFCPFQPIPGFVRSQVLLHISDQRV